MKPIPIDSKPLDFPDCRNIVAVRSFNYGIIHVPPKIPTLRINPFAKTV
jgi:hypothetical protein